MCELALRIPSSWSNVQGTDVIGYVTGVISSFCSGITERRFVYTTVGIFYVYVDWLLAGSELNST
jgi:hypothetical protein